MPKGNFLERQIARIFELSGFEPEVREIIKGYEVDVFLDYKTVSVAVECKQYAKGNLTVRNLIHEWSSKQEEIGVDKIVLALSGCTITEEDRDLANQRGITLWDDEQIDELLEIAIEEERDAKDRILMAIGLEGEQELEERIRETAEKHGISDILAEEVLRGDTGVDEAKELQQAKNQIAETGTELTTEDLRRFQENDDYIGTPFRDVVKMMAEYGISDKKKARLLVENQGGSAHRTKYSSSKIKKMRRLMDEFGYTFEEASDIIDSLNPQMQRLNRMIKVRKEHPQIDLETIDSLLEDGYYFQELKDDIDEIITRDSSTETESEETEEKEEIKDKNSDGEESERSAEKKENLLAFLRAKISSFMP